MSARQATRSTRGREADPAARSARPAPVLPAVGHGPPSWGNQALQGLLRSGVIQAKLTVNQPGDAYEKEADRVADQVMRMTDSAQTLARPGASPGDLVQRKCPHC